MINSRIFNRIFIMLWLILGALIINEMQANAALYDNPYVSLSPDGNAYTTNAGVTDTEWYEKGTMVYTGVESVLYEPGEGEHVYELIKEDIIPVGKWQVWHERAKCIHDVTYAGSFYYGVPFGRSKCGSAYFSGWFAYCADCGEAVTDRYYYMSDEAAKTMTQVDVSKAYYYKCPHCDNLEQAVEQNVHVCKAISCNRYFVRYHANLGSGYMAKSTHMYNDATMYEGQEVTPQTTLSLNTYTRKGYTFAGWNTEQDGSGTHYEDGATIYNLTSINGDSVILYAQWKECQSVLEIDPAGGTYQGNGAVTVIESSYGETYEVEVNELVPPAGYVVHFDTRGGKAVGDMVAQRRLWEWRQSVPFYGDWEDTVYYFGASDGAIDRITAVYEDLPLFLPQTSKEGYSFGGWYLDEGCTQLVGGAGSSFTPGRDLTLYAGWVDLQLISVDNYVANGGTGAVDLYWSQKDNSDKLYLVYQRTEEGDWEQITSSEKENTSYEADVTIVYTGQEGTYTAPFSGFYELTLYGAQGGNYGAYQGGKGGSVQATVYLEKGESLNYVVGGQNGYHGGGVGQKYANGGGYSQVSTSKYGTLMIAGGGGGASPKGNGEAGGLGQRVISTSQGEAGASGGGGGYQGGAAGVLEVHEHKESCKHVHSGTSSVYGGCYTEPVTCQNTQFDKVQTGTIFYFGNRDEYGNLIYCVRCGSYECPGHLDPVYGYDCTVCRTRYSTKPSACTKLSAYAPGCGLNGAYICGMKEGEVLSAEPAYGGSNYINKEYCLNFVQEAGVKSFDGLLRIEAQLVGAIEENQLLGVGATDLAKPNSIDVNSVVKTAVGEKEIRISFAKPKDNGTTYYHQVKSVDKGTNQLLCTSNETINTLTSGVVGYYYVVNASSRTKVTTWYNYMEENGTTPFVIVESADSTRYLHVAAVDKAGNLSDTVHIKVSNQDVVYWPLRTEQIQLEPGKNIAMAAGENTYFVKADGTTPFEVSFEGLLCGAARPTYQISHTGFEIRDQATGKEGTFTVLTPNRESVEAGTYTYPMQQLQKQIAGELPVQDGAYTVTKRYNQCKSIRIAQRFTIASYYNGQEIRLTPKVAALTGKETIVSDGDADLANSIYIIADGQGPVIYGTEKLEELDYLDLEAQEQLSVVLTAWDDVSGLTGFYAEIHNPESATTVRYEDLDGDGKITFTVSAEEMVYHGQFNVQVYAEDAVGNTTVISTDLLGVGLTAYVERILEPKDAPFKRGESGVLHIQTTGYVERVEVSFPQDLEPEGGAYSCTYIYEQPEYIQTECLEFMIPLTAVDGTKTIQVKAYKAGTELEKEPQLVNIVVKDSVLDELRTRLR